MRPACIPTQNIGCVCKMVSCGTRRACSRPRVLDGAQPIVSLSRTQPKLLLCRLTQTWREPCGAYSMQMIFNNISMPNVRSSNKAVEGFASYMSICPLYQTHVTEIDRPKNIGKTKGMIASFFHKLEGLTLRSGCATSGRTHITGRIRCRNRMVLPVVPSGTAARCFLLLARLRGCALLSWRYTICELCASLAFLRQAARRVEAKREKWPMKNERVNYEQILPRKCNRHFFPFL